MPLSLVLDIIHARTKKATYADAAYYSMVGGYVGGLAAALAGLGDYLTISPRSKTKRYADVHLTLNLGMMSLYTINLLLRRSKRPPSGPVPLALNLIGNLGLIVSAWYGGHMVYAQGMRVKDKETGEPEIKLPIDDKIEKAFHKLEHQLAPSATRPAKRARKQAEKSK
jgi:uncharacterized membrane protein